MIKNNLSAISKDTPLAMLTIGQLSSFLGLDAKNEERHTQEDKSGRSYVYGLKGIQELFHVSHTTAQIYKDGILKDAVYQSGRKIVVDVEKAIALFNARKEEK